MRKSSMVFSAILFAITILLTGCIIYPYWWDDEWHGHGGRDGGHHEDGGGHRGGGGGRH